MPAEADPEPQSASSVSDVTSSNLVPARAVAAGSGPGGGLLGLAALGGLGAAAGGGGSPGSAPLASGLMPASTNTMSSVLATDTGQLASVASGGLTRDSTVGLSGTLAGGTTVAIYEGQVLLGSALVSGSNWSFVTPALSDGLHTLTAQFSSAQGQTSTQSVSVTVDTQASGTWAPRLLTDAGVAAFVGEGDRTTDASLGLSGTAEPSSLVRIFDGTFLLGSVTLGAAATTWSYTTPALDAGDHALSVTITDPAGNVKSFDPVNLSIASEAQVSGFSIDFVYTGASSAYASYFLQAASFWSSVIVGDLPDAQGVDDLSIRVSVLDIDGDGPAGRTAGQAAITAFRPSSLLPYQAELEVDSVLLPRLIAEGQLYNLLRHEIGHALGFGFHFDKLGLVDGVNPNRYVGANALAQYRKLGQPNAAFIPLEDQGGAGTAGGHWKESVFDSELMTGFLESGRVAQPVSALTLGALQDLGYSVDYKQAEFYALPSPFASAVMP
jgi:hypothetical protein